MQKRHSYTKREFKEKLEKFWSDSGYNYELVDFDPSEDHMYTNKKVKFKCNECGAEYEIIARRLLEEQKRCKYCTSKERAIGRTTTQKEFLDHLYDVYGKDSQYDLEKTASTFTKMAEPLTVYCNIHGPYTIKRAFGFYRGVGCRKCWDSKVGDLTRRSVDTFIQQSIDIWGPDRWGYDKVVYVNNNTKVTLFCKIHNEYFEQVPSSHLYGFCGCNKCKPFSKGEEKVREYLVNHSIPFKKNQNYQVDTGEIARTEPRINVDFVLNSGKLWIEYNGQQHYEYSSMYHNHSHQNFWNQVHRDTVQHEMAERQGIELLVIPYPDLDRITEVLDAFFGPNHQDITTHLEPVLLPVPLYYYHYGQNKTIEAKGSSIP
jgi:DNA-directed RNA polymerase subunit RPC12/RpoP